MLLAEAGRTAWIERIFKEFTRFFGRLILLDFAEWVFMLPILIAIAPFTLTLTDLIRGELRWDPVDVAHTYARALVGLFGALALMFGVLAVGAVSIVGVISLVVSLGDLMIYGLNPAHSWTTPVICTLNDFKGPHCGGW